MMRRKWRFLALLLSVSLVLPASANATSPTQKTTKQGLKKGALQSKTNKTNSSNTLVKSSTINANTSKAPMLSKPIKTTKQKRTLQKSTLQNKTRDKFAKDELIIKYKPGVSSQVKKSFTQKSNLKVLNKLSSKNIELVKLPKGANLDNTMKSLKKNSAVAYIQPNYYYYTSSLSSEPLGGELWGLENTGQPILDILGKNDIDIDANDAWSTTEGNSNVVVGLIDTGVDINHPDLKDNIWTNPNEIPNNGTDDDQNGFVDDVHGWDFFYNDNSVFDEYDGDEHGTHTAGTIAAANNQTGVVGVAPNVKIMPIKFLGMGGYGTTLGAIYAIEYAKKMGVKITSNSWAGYSIDPLLEETIKNSGQLFVAAAGNESINNDNNNNWTGSRAYPASYDLPNVLSVAAVDNKGELAWFSNYGEESTDIAAPGVDILSSIPKYPNLPAAIFADSGYGTQTFYQGFGLEDVKTAEEQQEIMQKALSTFNFSTGKVLLVQDDASDAGSDNVLPVYQAALDSTEFTYDVMTVGKASDGPTLEKMQEYDAVIWFTGQSLSGNNKPNITDNDEKNIINYLITGGKLYLSGRDALFGKEYCDLAFDWLHAVPVLEMEGKEDKTVLGVENTVFADKTYNYNTEYEDILLPVDNIAKPILVYPTGSTYQTAYEYYSGTSMATPHVSGAAALLQSSGITDPLRMKYMLLRNTSPLKSLNGKVLTGGMLNAPNPLTEVSLNEDDNMPGIALQTNNSGTLDIQNDTDDVYSTELKAGETITYTLKGAQTADFDLYVYGDRALTVKNAQDILAYSETEGNLESITFTAPKAGKYFIDAAAFKGTGSYTLSMIKEGETAADDSSALLKYAGKWTTVSNSSYQNGTAKTLNSKGSVSFDFYGDKIRWYGFKDANQGIASVYLDGEKVKDVSLYSKTASFNQSIFEKQVALGSHTLEIVWTGKSDPLAKKGVTTINVDSIVSYNSEARPAAPKNAASENVYKGVKILFPNKVEGAVKYQLYRSVNNGAYAKIKELTSDANSSTTKPNYIEYVDRIQDNKKYSYKVTAVNAADLESANSAEVTGQALLPNSVYKLQDSNKNLKYTGKWTTEKAKAYNGGSRAVSTEKGAKIVIPFTGYEAAVYSWAGSSYGKVKMTVSNGKTVYSQEIDLKDASEKIKSFSYLSDYKINKGTITLEVVTGKVNFDYVEIKDITNTAPAAPVDVKTSRTDKQVTVSWSANKEVDVVGYNVYRSTTPGKGYVKLTKNPIEDLTYADTTTDKKKTYYYVVTAVNGANLESKYSAQAKVNPYTGKSTIKK